MRALCEWIKERTPEELWTNFQISDRFATPEGVAAFIKVYKRVRKTRPIREPFVLMDVKSGGDSEERDELIVIDDNGRRDIHVPVCKENLRIILGIYIPDQLYYACKITAINVLFRNLVSEELKKSKYETMRLQRKLTEELSDHRWMKKYQFNFELYHLAVGLYDIDMKQEPMNHIYIEFPEIGRPLYWDTLVRCTDYSEEFCKSLYPDNPPSNSRIKEAVGMIHKQLSLRGRGMIQASHLREQLVFEGMMSDKTELGETIKKRIIVDKNNIPGAVIPIIYTVDEEGRRQEIQSDTLDNIAEYAVIVRDERWKRDYRTMVGYILLYLTYPLRMHREMRTLQVREMIYLLKQRSDSNLSMKLSVFRHMS